MKNDKDSILNNIVFCPSDVIKGLSDSLAKIVVEDNDYNISEILAIGLQMIEGVMDYLTSIHSERINGIDRKDSQEPLGIMCKDCKWCEERNDSLYKIPYLLCKNWNEETDALGFCYKAERRANG